MSLIVVTVCVRLLWGLRVSLRLRAELDEIRRRGEPAALADIVIEPVPDPTNAWVVYTRAFAAINPKTESPRQSGLEYPNYPPYGKKWEQLAAASERGNARALALARQARPLTRSHCWRGAM